MDQKVVLITGASRGIGAAIAKKMASLNYHVVINYLNSKEKAICVQQDIEKSFKVKSMLIQADISKEDEVKKMVAKTLEKFGHIDCLVNNAALCQDNYFPDKTVSEFQTVLNTNLLGTFLVSKYVGEVMLKQKSGRIINISSTNAINTFETYSMDYDASKAGVISLTKNFAKALAPYVLVNAIAPGWVSTDSVLEMNPNYLEEERKKCLLNRFAHPEEIANVVAFLASDEASYINGSILRVDGGAK